MRQKASEPLVDLIHPAVSINKATTTLQYKQTSNVVPAVTSETDPCKLFAGSDSLVPICLSYVNLTVRTNTACLLSVIVLLSGWSYHGEAPAVEAHRTYLFSVALSKLYSVHSLLVCKVKEGEPNDPNGM